MLIRKKDSKGNGEGDTSIDIRIFNTKVYKS